MDANLKLINRERKENQKFYLQAKSPFLDTLKEAFRALLVVSFNINMKL